MKEEEIRKIDNSKYIENLKTVDTVERERERGLFSKQKIKHSGIIKNNLKWILLVIAIIMGIIAVYFGESKYVTKSTVEVQLTFNSYKILEEEIKPSVREDKDGKLQVDIESEKPEVKVQYRTNESEEWQDYDQKIHQ